MKLYSLLIDSVNEAIRKQKSDGSFPPGHNGPYNDIETPVRNTSHWLITLLKVYKITDDKFYLDSAYEALKFIMSPEARPMYGSFWHRENSEKDFSNGLIGQAWTIEALVEAHKTFNDKNILSLAKEVFLLHPYDTKAGGWRIVNVDGSFNHLDYTFNHQLWFAAVGSSLAKLGIDEVRKTVDDFIGRLDEHLQIYRDGLIKHLSPNTFNSNFKKQIYRNILYLLQSRKEKNYMRMKSVGYHPFNLYGFALLKQNYPSHMFWESQKFKKILRYIKSESFKKEIDNSKYSFPYNPPGFEISFALQVFEGEKSKGEISNWLSTQINKCFDFEKKLMTKGSTKDPTTLAARIYEATRLKNYNLHLS